jgi:hypothetical protein
MRGTVGISGTDRIDSLTSGIPDDVSQFGGRRELGQTVTAREEHATIVGSGGASPGASEYLQKSIFDGCLIRE